MKPSLHFLKMYINHKKFLFFRILQNILVKIFTNVNSKYLYYDRLTILSEQIIANCLFTGMYKWIILHESET